MFEPKAELPWDLSKLRILMNKIQNALLSHFVLKNIDTVLVSIIELMEKIRVSPVQDVQDDINILSSHLSALRHCLRFYLGKSILSESLNKYILSVKREVNGPGNEKNGGTAIQPDQDDIEQEQRMVEDQQYLDNLADDKNEKILKKFLFDCWAYLIKERRPSKKIFISYAWPKEYDDPNQEAWSKTFLAKLVEHLIQSGMQVYLDQYHSGPGKFLGSFMGKINDKIEYPKEELYLDINSGYEIDHVLVVSSRTLVDKLENTKSGCYCEHGIIQKRLTEEKGNRFIIPIQLNLKNYLPMEFSNIVGINFCKQTYLENFKELFSITNRFNYNFIDWSNSKTKIYRLGLDVYIAEGIKEKYLSPEIAGIKYLLYQNSVPIYKSYINLVLIKEKERQEKEKNFVRKDNHKSRDQQIKNHEDLHKPKEIISINEITGAKNGCQEKSDKHILIEGRSGIGKTILMRYFANQWALKSTHPDKKIDWLRNYDAVVWLPLRLLHGYNECIDLASFIHKECFSAEYFKKLSPDIIQRGLINNPNITVLYLLDGFDEVSSLFHEKSSHINLLRSLLKMEHWIISSRPYHINIALLNEFRHLEIIGFLDENIRSYVKNFFANCNTLNLNEQEAKSQSLLTMLFLNQNIKSIAHIPINLELICSIWEDKVLDFESNVADNTMTTLYHNILILLLKRYLLRLQEIKILTDDTNILDLMDVEIISHEKCQSALDFLQELAWLTMQGNTLLIKPNVIKGLIEKHFPSGIKDKLFIENLFRHLFILKPSGESKRSFLDQTYYFIHLTFQEFFAAQYVVKKLEQDNIPIKNFILSNKFDSRFEVVWWFVAGLLKNKEIPLNLFFELLEDEFAGENFENLSYQKLMIRCMDECGLAITESKKEIFLRNLANYLSKLVWENYNGGFTLKIILNYLSMSINVFNQTKIAGLPHLVRTIMLHSTSYLPEPVLQKLVDKIKSDIRVGDVNSQAVDILCECSEFLSLSHLNQLVGILIYDDQICRERASRILNSRKFLPEKILKALVQVLLEIKENWWTKVYGSKGDQYFNAGVYLASHILINKSPLPQKIFEKLISLLKSVHSQAKHYAGVILLEQVPLSKEMLEQLIYHLKDQNIVVRYNISCILREQPDLPENIVKQISGLLINKDLNIKIYALRSIYNRLSLPDGTLLQFVIFLEEELSHLISIIEKLINDPFLLRKLFKKLISLLNIEDVSFLDEDGLVINSDTFYSPEEILEELVCLFVSSQNINNIVEKKLCNKLPSDKEIYQKFDYLLKYAQIRDFVGTALTNQIFLSEKILEQLVSLLKNEQYAIRKFAQRILINRSPLPQKICKILACLSRQSTDHSGKLAKSILNKGIFVEDEKNWGVFTDKNMAKCVFTFFNAQNLKNVGCVSRGCYNIRKEVENERSETNSFSL